MHFPDVVKNMYIKIPHAGNCVNFLSLARKKQQKKVKCYFWTCGRTTNGLAIKRRTKEHKNDIIASTKERKKKQLAEN